MGIFGSSGDEKARKKAAKAGIDVQGALAVGATYDEGATQFLVVHPDRVEWHSKGRTGSLLRAGAGSQVVSMGAVSSTSVGNEGIWGVVRVTSSNSLVEFKTDVKTAGRLSDAIRAARQRL